MRQVLVGVLLFFLGLFADFFLEHTVKRAPDWVPRLIAALFIPFGVLVVLLSDPVWPHLYGVKMSPFKSSLIAAFAGACIIGSLWYFLVARKSEHATRPPAYPEIDASISGSTAEVFLVNKTAKPVTASVRIIESANKFDQKTLTSRQMPPSTIDLGRIAVGGRKHLTKVELTDDYEEAVFVAADLGEGTNFTRPLAYRAYFRKPAQVWQFEYALHDSYERRKLLQRGGTPEDAAQRRRRVRFKLSQLIMHGSMLKQGFEWLCVSSVDEKTRAPVDPTEKLGRATLDIQAWGAEAVFWTNWELGDSYVARLTTPMQSAQYPRGFEELPNREFYRDSWDRLTAYLSKLEEFLKELPEL
ncbi:MAG: hypothetical protein ACXW5U_19035 [Thermoanaerobaculia bacterium]